MKKVNCLLRVFRAHAVGRWRDDQGSILPLTLMIVVVLATMVGTLLAVGTMEPQIATNLVRSGQALNLAEAGAEHAIAQFAANSAPISAATCGPCPGPSVTLLDAQQLQNLGTYTVTYRPIAATTVLIESTGQTTIGNATQRVRLVATATAKSPFALLGDDIQISGNAKITGDFANVHGNTNAAISGTAHVDLTMTSAGKTAATCSGCTDPKYVGVPAGSGFGKPTQQLPTDNPLNYVDKADFVMGDDPLNPTILVRKATPNCPTPPCTVPQNTGDFVGWTMNTSQPGDWHYHGSSTPPNGMYYASSEISIDTSPGSPASPWQATLISGSSLLPGELEIAESEESHPTIVPYYQDLLGVAGAWKVLGHANLTGTVISTTKSRPQVCTQGGSSCNPLRPMTFSGEATLNGQIIADGQVKVLGDSQIIYDSGGAGGGSSLQILSWTRLSQ